MKFYRMDPLEVAGGWVHGYGPARLPDRPGLTPRAALERSLLKYLTRDGCHIAFSGGRDSSALLAVAVNLARREGLALPIPVTLVYPGAEATHESPWQTLVLEHLGITEREVITVSGEHDALGPIASPVLARHGTLWPPNFAPNWRMMDRVRGGSLLTGENGDELFGAKRVTPLTNTLKSIKARRAPDRRLYPLVASALAPSATRRRIAMRDRLQRFWLRPSIDSILAERSAADFSAHSLHAGRHGWQFTNRRCATLGFDTFLTLGQEIGTCYGQPFSEPEFVSAVANKAGFFGWSGRDQTMNRLFGDVLPRDVLLRQSKATFRHAVFNEHTRAFARTWDGSGVDTNLVDAAALRENWQSDLPHALTLNLLQQAWLASQPAPTTAPTGPSGQHRLPAAWT